MPRKKQPRDITKARALRQAMSLPEVLLWRELRQQQEVKFRRQHPVGPYVLDFYCGKAKLCVEVDGISHDMGDRPWRDGQRNQWLRDAGIEVVRVLASDALADAKAVAESLAGYCKR
jgi:very-short-patch-repair endonuclease